MRPITELHIRTNCDGCPESCCSQPYDWVYLTSAESRALSIASGLAETEFVTPRINTAAGFRFSVLELPCRFYEASTGHCTVYAVRPLVCRLFPFYVDPMTGDGMLLPAQCDDRLEFVEEPGSASWSLAQYGDSIREWVQTLWNEANERQSNPWTVEG